MEERTLTPDQIRFVAEYVIDRNATRAYLRVYPGVTYKSASELARRLLEKVEIRAEVEAAAREHARRCGIDARRTLREYGSVAFADLGDLFEEDPHTGYPKARRWSEVPAATRRAVQTVKIKRRRVSRRNKDGDEDTLEETEEVEYKLHPKMEALEKIGRHLGLWREGIAQDELLARIREFMAARETGTAPVYAPGGPPPDVPSGQPGPPEAAGGPPQGVPQ